MLGVLSAHAADGVIGARSGKSLKAWGDVLHDPDLAETIVDRLLERGRSGPARWPFHQVETCRPCRPQRRGTTCHSFRHRPARFSGTYKSEGRGAGALRHPLSLP